MEPAANEVHDQRAPRRLIRLRVVTERTGLSRTTIYRTMAQPGGFPMPVRITPGLVAWVEAEIEAWIEQKILLDRVSAYVPVLNAWEEKIASWCTTSAANDAPLTTRRILREALKVEAARVNDRGMATRVGLAMSRLGYQRTEDKTIPERFRYEKPSAQEEEAR